MELRDAAQRLERALQAGRSSDARRLVSHLFVAIGTTTAELEDAQTEAARLRMLLDRTLRVTAADGAQPVAEEALDAVMAIVEAPRGFVGAGEGRGWTLLAARNLERVDLDDPAALVSTSIIELALERRTPIVTHDAGLEVPTQSVRGLALRSVACLPLVDGERLLGFVYLDNAKRPGVFDDAAVAAVTAWLPVVARSVARATAAPVGGGLPGVVTRSRRLTATLTELRRIAQFEASVLLTGETGTGKSLIARRLHEASGRAGGPFVHVNCGAIPEALIEGELFGAEAGAYTGAKARRKGRFEAADGGTLFLDELDSMPLACQVKLLVALQDRTITRLGSNVPVPVDVRVVAAMGSDPFEAIAAGRVREDLYYRLAVFVAELPPLRDRPEDIPLLAQHVLERTRERYGLPSLRLSPTAERTLLGHTWPGNVRELENALDRAALLSQDGVIDTLRLGARRGRGEAVQLDLAGLLRGAADRVAAALVGRADLRDLKALGVFRGAVLEALARRLGSEEAAFELLGLEAQVAARNHKRTWRREVGRLEALLAAVE